MVLDRFGDLDMDFLEIIRGNLEMDELDEI